MSQKDLELFFGKGYQLKKIKQLTQPCDFAAEEKLDIEAPGGRISNVRIVGPVREKTQVEMSFTDAINLGIMPPIKISGDLKETPGITLIGPESKVELKEGVIIAKRHLHCATAEAEKLGLKDGQEVSIKIEGDRATTFHNIIVRVREDYKLCLHLDTDEGNAVGISKMGEGILIQ